MTENQYSFLISMETNLHAHIKQIIPHCPHSEIELIVETFTLIKVKKKEIFLDIGAVCRLVGFVEEGCFRNFIISSAGSTWSMGIDLLFLNFNRLRKVVGCFDWSSIS